MSTYKWYSLILALMLLGGAALVAMTWAAPGKAPLAGGTPTVVAYQGEVRVSDGPYTGDGHFKFAVVNAGGNTSYWSNDGTSTGGARPTAAVPLAVSDGLFSVLLGDTTLGGMTQAMTAGVFSQPDRYLRVWFSSDNITFEQLTPDTRIAAVPYALQAQEAVDADTVDGLHANELETHYQGVVVVAKSGGDYSSVQAAIDSINTAGGLAPHLVWVAPGMYVEQVTMKPYVHLQGAGQGATVIQSNASSSAWPPDQATLTLARDTSLRDLTVGNSGTGDNNVALLATEGMTRTVAADVTLWVSGGGTSNYAIYLSGSGTRVTLRQVIALAENSINNYGLFNYDAAAVLHDGGYTGRGGGHAVGIYNFHSNTTLEAIGVTALAENGYNNYGLENCSSAEAVLRGGSFTGRGGTNACGIYNHGNSTALTVESVTALGEDASDDNYGLFNARGAAAALRSGAFTGRGGYGAVGIYNFESNTTLTTLETENVSALAEDASKFNYGLYNNLGAQATLHGGSFTGRGGSFTLGIYNDNSATTDVTQSVLDGEDSAVYRAHGSVTVSNSRLIGGTVAGTVTCVAVTYGTAFYASSCP